MPSMFSHTATYVSSYDYMRVHRYAKYVSSYCYICVLIRLYVSAQVCQVLGTPDKNDWPDGYKLAQVPSFFIFYLCPGLFHIDTCSKMDLYVLTCNTFLLCLLCTYLHVLIVYVLACLQARTLMYVLTCNSFLLCLCYKVAQHRRVEYLKILLLLS